MTRLLQDSLGGNSKSTIIANVAPGTRAFSNTQRTLEFAALSRAIINTPSINVAAPVAAPAPAAPSLALSSLASRSTLSDSSAAHATLDQESLERKIVEKIKKAGLDSLATQVKQLVDLNTKKNKQPPKTPNTRTKEYQSHIVRAKAFEKDGLMLDALDELNKAHKKMSQDDLITKALPTSAAAAMFKAVKTKIDRLTQTVNEMTKKNIVASAATVVAPAPKANLLSSFNSANKENLSQAQANADVAAASKPAAVMKRAPPRKRKRVEVEDDDSYDESKNVAEQSESESEEERPAPIVKPAPKRTKKVPTEEDEVTEKLAAKQRIRDSLSSFGQEIHAEISKLVTTFNEGTQKDITKLHGIGKKRAELIISHRSNSPIRAIEQLLEVTGISEKILDNIIKTNVITVVFFEKQKEEARHLEALRDQQRLEYMAEPAIDAMVM